MSEPKLEEVVISVSFGGKVQIIKYEIGSDYHVSQTRRYSIPEDWNNVQAEEFQAEEHDRLRSEVEEVAQKELDALLDAKSAYG
jgi:hypothetical protein